MGISKAKGMALANRLSGNRRRIFVLTGDGELQEGQFWESLVSGVNRGLSEMGDRPADIADYYEYKLKDVTFSDCPVVADLEQIEFTRDSDGAGAQFFLARGRLLRSQHGGAECFARLVFAIQHQVFDHG